MFRLQIADFVRAYISGSLSRDLFEDIFLSSTWNLSDDFIGSVRALMAEFDRGDLNEDELKDALAEVMGPDAFVVASGSSESIQLIARELVAAAA